MWQYIPLSRPGKFVVVVEEQPFWKTKIDMAYVIFLYLIAILCCEWSLLKGTLSTSCVRWWLYNNQLILRRWALGDWKKDVLTNWWDGNSLLLISLRRASALDVMWLIERVWTGLGSAREESSEIREAHDIKNWMVITSQTRTLNEIPRTSFPWKRSLFVLSHQKRK